MHFNTRNNEQLLLKHPPVGTNRYGRRAFSYTVPTVWSKVPDYIRNAPSLMSFKKQLNTYYFGIFRDCLMVASCVVRKSYRF